MDGEQSRNKREVLSVRSEFAQEHPSGAHGCKAMINEGVRDDEMTTGGVTAEPYRVEVLSTSERLPAAHNAFIIKPTGIGCDGLPVEETLEHEKIAHPALGLPPCPTS